MKGRLRCDEGLALPDAARLSSAAGLNGLQVLEYGALPQPTLPTGYIAPSDGTPSLLPIKNLAICRADSVEGYYLLFFTQDWQYVTFEYNETLEYTKRCPKIELGQDVIQWQKHTEPFE